MSAFLGPIHFWLYRKIKLQQNLADYILDNSNIEDIDSIRFETNRIFGEPETRELESVIDELNIHGWLQEQVSCAENRLAYYVTMILKNNSDNMNSIAESAAQFGRLNKIEYTESAITAWKEIDDRLLSGMPCDRVNQITEQSDSILEYIVTTDIHKDYWDSNKGEACNYYVIMESFIKGMISDCPLTYVKTGNDHYCISRKEYN